MTKKRMVRKLTPKELANPERLDRQRRQLEIRKQIYAAGDRLAKKRREFILSIASDAHAPMLHEAATEEDYLKEGRRLAKLRLTFLRDTTNPLELHLFATNWNCDADEGVQPLYKIATHANCDAGTALWLYWEQDPYFAMAFRTVKDADAWQELFVKLSRTIERRFIRNDFATAKIPFDPTPWVTDKYDKSEWVAHKIPDVMYKPISAKKRAK